MMLMADVGKWGQCARIAACIVIPLSLTLFGCGGGDAGTTPSPTTVTTTAMTTITTTIFSFSGFACTSDLKIAPTVNMAGKGLCLDDTTFKDCEGQMPGLWPNTQEVVKHLRLFSAWKKEWGDDTKRDATWAKLVKFVKDQNAKVFFGVLVTCDPVQDMKDWEQTLQLMKLVGPEHVSVVGFGNEMDVFWRGQTPPKPSRQCLVDLWGGRFWSFIQECQGQMDAAGFSDAKLTSTWAMTVLATPGQVPAVPFKENTGAEYAKVNTLLTQAFQKYGKERWVWTYNIYAIWDATLYHLDPGSSTQCTKAIDAATGPYIDNYIVSVRKAMKKITNNDDDLLFVGETGWSSPCPNGLDPTMQKCPFCSHETFRKIYANFLSWDFSVTDQNPKSKTLGQKFKGPDLAYYFTLRDSNNGGAPEYFGLMKSCSDTTCKLSLSNTQANASALAVTVV